MWSDAACLFLVATLCETMALEPIVKQVGENATLRCPQLLGEDSVDSIIWMKDTDPLLSIGENQLVKFSMTSIEERVALTNGQQITLANLEVTDSGQYICQVDTINKKRGSLEPRISTHELLVVDVPTAPGKPDVLNVQARQATFRWAPSNSNNSPVLTYQLQVSECDGNATDNVTMTNKTVEKTVVGLSPLTCYTAQVLAANSVGYSEPSEASIQFVTAPEFDSTTWNVLFEENNFTLIPPSEVPREFRVMKVSSTEIELAWRSPFTSQASSNLEGYEIRYGAPGQVMRNVSIDDPERTSVLLQSLKPHTLYIVTITAKNLAGSGPELTIPIMTEEGIPLKPRITHISNHKSTSFYVNWEPPREINGRLIMYELQWMNGANVKSRYIAGHLVDTMTAFVSDLSPYTEYKVQVAAVTNGGRGEFSEPFPALTDVAAPSAPRHLNVTELSLNSLFLSWDPPQYFNKNIDNYLIRGSDHRGLVIEQDVKGQVTKHTLKDLATNARYHLKVAAITNAIFGPDPDKMMGEFTDAVVITLGAYEIKGSNVILDVSSHDVTTIGEGESSTGLIAGITCGILCVLIFSALVVGYRFYTCRKCYQAAYIYLAVPSNGHTIQPTVVHMELPAEEKQYQDIPVSEFISHVKQKHSDGDFGFSQEFDEINRTSMNDKYPCESSNLPENHSKNRYINIVAYDHSRVVLKTEIGRPRQEDYINANYVDGYKQPKAYIATQGPLPLTFVDFWRMVWEQNSNVIVMITNLVEKGRRKCDQYWPNDGAETYGSLNVKLIKMVHRAHYTVRIFALRHLKSKKRHSMKGAAERTIYHFHYTEWPDHGVPDYSLPVLSFVQKSAALKGPENGPIIVHCSAGVGRTGTYILIDSMIAQMQDQMIINIPAFTRRIRRQRNFLVQTEDQYIFIHEVLVEYILASGATEVREEHLLKHLTDLSQPSQELFLPTAVNLSLLERQYQQITEYKPEEEFSSALKPVNQDKNRVGGLLPVNLKRVLLPARPGVEGSDYINATYLQGYKKSAEFIVTQHPTEETMEDFWRMVWDKNSPIIIVLSSFDDEEYKEFWPPKGSSIDVDSGNFRLTLKDEPTSTSDGSISTLEFILDSIQYDYTLMSRIVCVQSWPENCSSLPEVFDVIISVYDYVNSLECGPIIVMDRFGGVEAGTFCALWTLRDQLISENCADFYKVCKLYHYKRPGIIGSQENYMFLHQALAAYYTLLQDVYSSGASSPRYQRYNSLNQGNQGSIQPNILSSGNSPLLEDNSVAMQSPACTGSESSILDDDTATMAILDTTKVETDI